MAGKITLTTFGIGAYGLQSGKIHWMALGCQQWGLAKIQPPGSVVNLNISCDIYCVSATSIDGDWLYIKLIDNTQFKIVVNAQKAFWICLGILKQQWGYNTQSEDYNVKVALPIAYAIKHYIVVSNAEDQYAGDIYVTGSYKLTLTNFMLSKTKSTHPVFWISLGIQQWGVVQKTTTVYD